MSNSLERTIENLPVEGDDSASIDPWSALTPDAHALKLRADVERWNDV
jgi:hypothetical protein